MNPTHIYVDEEKIYISPNLNKTFNFLIEIDKEVKSFIQIKDQIKKVTSQILEYTQLMESMAKLIADNNIDFNFSMSEHPKTLIEKLKFKSSPRAEFIAIFSYLETLRNLYKAYQLKTDDQQELRNASDNILEDFYKDFCLSNENQWIIKNSKISGKMSKEKLVKLRNSLVHFFSIHGGICITPDNQQEDNEKIMKQINNKALFISPLDLYQITHGALSLILQRWIDDSKSNNEEFVERIQCVQNITEKNSAIIMTQN